MQCSFELRVHVNSGVMFFCVVVSKYVIYNNELCTLQMNCAILFFQGCKAKLLLLFWSLYSV